MIKGLRAPSPWLFIPFGILGTLHLLSSALNFISHSEFWAINVAQIFGEISSESLVLYYKPLFYLPLRALFFFDLDQWTHIQMGRLLFGFFAALLSCLVLLNSWLLNQRLSSLYLTLIFLLSSPLYMYNIFRVRADLLANLGLWIGITILNLQPWTREGLTEKFSRQLHFKLGLTYLLILLATPKGIYFLLILSVYHFTLLSLNRSILFRTSWFDATMSLLTPIGLCLGGAAAMVAIQGVVMNPYVLAFDYFLTNWNHAETSSHFNHVLTNFKIHFIHVLLVIGVAVCMLRAWPPLQATSKAFLLCGLGAGAVILFHPERWPYFLAQWVPLWAVLVSLGAPRVKQRFMEIGLLSVLLFSPLFVTNWHSWFRTNHDQKEVIQEIGKMAAATPEPSYYDGTGLLPRTPSLHTFLGPNDPGSTAFTLRKLHEQPPLFIFYTAKMDIAQPDVLVFLYESYTKVQGDIWIHKRLPREDWPPLPSQPLPIYSLFIYDYSPYLRF